MRPAVYLFINKGLSMSTGKVASQAAQATAEMLKREPENWLTHQWLYKGGHHMTLVMECRDSDHLRDTQEYLDARFINSYMQIDEGHTEVDPITPTALVTQVVNKDDPHVAATLSSFKLYRDPEPTKRRKWLPFSTGS